MSEDAAGREAERFCPNCGRQVEAGANFCPACGHNLYAPASPTQQAPPLRQQRPPDESALAWIVRGGGITLGACIIFILIFIVFPLILFVSCMALSIAGSQ